MPSRIALVMLFGAFLSNASLDVHEAKPTEAPTNFTFKEKLDSTVAMFGWHPVSPESVNGHLKGYKIESWSENESDAHIFYAQADSNNALLSNLRPNALNYARIRALNNQYEGPASATISFQM